MELMELLAVLRRRLWTIVLVPLVAALTAAGVSLYVLQPTYEAKTTLWVVKTDGAALDYNTLLFNRNLTKTYGEVAHSRSVANQVIQQLGLAESAASLQSRVKVNPVRDTELIAITVTDGDPDRAAAITNTLAAVFSQEIRNFIKLDNVRVVDRATVSVDPVRPRPFFNTAVALALGLMLGTGIAFLLEQLDVSFRAPEDVEKHLDLAVIGLVPVLEPATDEDVSAHRVESVASEPIAGGEG